MINYDLFIMVELIVVRINVRINEEWVNGYGVFS